MNHPNQKFIQQNSQLKYHPNGTYNNNENIFLKVPAYNTYGGSRIQGSVQQNMRNSQLNPHIQAFRQNPTNTQHPLISKSSQILHHPQPRLIYPIQSLTTQQPRNIRFMPAVQNTPLTQHINSKSPRIRSISPQPQVYPSLIKNDNIQKYQALRWQNKYEDLKVKYDQLKDRFQSDKGHLRQTAHKGGHYQNQDVWILRKQNQIYRDKIRQLQTRDQLFYHQLLNKLEKTIDFHQHNMNKECELLVDRFRLENKVLDKI